jgi:Mrp family chromosome partitioning ATPase
VAANLAFSLSHQTDCRTVLVDLDLRRPQIGALLGLGKLPVMEKFLRGQSEIRDVFLRYGDNLAIGANGQSVRFSAELLQSAETARVLQELKQRLNPGVVLFDLPPMYPNDDVMAFLPNVDCVLMVAAAGYSTSDEVATCEQELFEKTNVLGVVLNKCRYGHGKYWR